MVKRRFVTRWVLLVSFFILFAAITGTATATALPGYAYYKTHAIAGSEDRPLADYQMRFVVHRWAGDDSGEDVYLGGRSLSWPNDIRFADGASNFLDYWIESSNEESAIIWVKVPSIPEGGTTIDINYGKVKDAGTGDGATVWEFFDSFDTLDTSKWKVEEGSPYVSDGVLVCSDSGVISRNNISSAGKRFVIGIRTAHFGDTSCYESIQIARNGPRSLEADFAWGGEAAKSHTYVNWIDGYSLGYYDIRGWSAGDWHTLIAKRLDNKIQWSVDMANPVDCPRTYWVYSGQVHIWSSGGGAETDVDWIGIGPVAEDEPAHGYWGPERRGLSGGMAIGIGDLMPVFCCGGGVCGVICILLLTFVALVVHDEKRHRK